jgi:hypothetical protein
MEMKITSLGKTVGAAFVVATLGAASASAMPAAGLGKATSEVGNTEQVRWVCNEWGRCWWRQPYYYGGPAYFYGGGPRFYGGGWRGGYRGGWHGGYRGGGWRGGRGRW